MQEFQGNDWGLWGWFECEDDPEARARAAGCGRGVAEGARGGTMIGPMSFTTNDECGLLIEGHEHPPIILGPWHHAYYQTLLERTSACPR